MMLNRTFRLVLLGILIGVSSLAYGVNLKEAVSGGDLNYTEPTTRSEEGMPVGNGRMGSLVWTVPSAIKFQINRVDVFGQDSSTVSFPRADTDYASGCGYVDINMNSAGDDVFTTATQFNQHLSVYDGLMSLQGGGVSARVIGWPKADVMAVEIDDQRENPESINIDLRMLRYMIQGFSGQNFNLMKSHAVMVQTANHYATSRLDIRDGRITLTQQFVEQDFYSSSAIAIGVEGRKSKPRYLNESTVQLSVAPGKGKFTILIASAASFDKKQDTAALALENIKPAAAKDFTKLQVETAAWWHDFWSTGFVATSSPDKQADFVGANYTYFMYLMNASSHGKYPPRFGGMIWYTNGDYRRWGSQYWQSNTLAYYRDLISSGHLDLMDPLFSMYFGMYDACALAAKQQWDSKGIFIPEITFFNGPDAIPDNLVKEFQDLYLARKDYEQRTPEFQSWVETKNRHNSRYNFFYDGKYVHGHLVIPTKGQGIFGHCTHFLSGAVNIVSVFWQYYEFTLDKNFLQKQGYPMIKGVAEFYRNFPNVKKEADGKYHIYHVNSGESNWDSTDTASELGAMARIFPMAVRASEILGVDEDLRPKWQDIADNLAEPGSGSGRRTDASVGSSVAPVIAGVTTAETAATPTPEPTDTPAAKKTRTKRAWSGAGAGGNRNDPNRPYGSFVYGGPGNIEPLGSEPELKSRFLGFTGLASFIDNSGIGGPQIFRNRMRLREGPGAIDAEHIGGLSFGIQQSLLVSTATAHIESVAIQVFPAWPKDWDVTFKLLARGGTEVTASQGGGKIQFVQLKARVGGKCSLVNPWPGSDATLYRGTQKAGDLSGQSLAIEMKKGETLTVVPKGAELPSIEIQS